MTKFMDIAVLAGATAPIFKLINFQIQNRSTLIADVPVTLFGNAAQEPDFEKFFYINENELCMREPALKLVRDLIAEAKHATA